MCVMVRCRRVVVRSRWIRSVKNLMVAVVPQIEATGKITDAQQGSVIITEQTAKILRIETWVSQEQTDHCKKPGQR